MISWNIAIKIISVNHINSMQNGKSHEIISAITKSHNVEQKLLNLFESLHQQNNVLLMEKQENNLKIQQMEHEMNRLKNRFRLRRKSSMSSSLNRGNYMDVTKGTYRAKSH